MNGSQRNDMNAQIWRKQNVLNYDGKYTSHHEQNKNTSHHFRSGTYEISGHFMFVAQSVQLKPNISAASSTSILR